MKKLLFLALALPLSASANYSWPSALSIPLMLPVITGSNTLTEAIADGMSFEHSRGISFNMSLPTTPRAPEPDEFGFVENNQFLTLSYNLRWGYQGAGDASVPFTGQKAQINIELSYEGLSFHLCKSRTLRQRIYKRLQPLLTIAPCEEFYLKIAQLVLSVSQAQKPDNAAVRSALETLIARLRLTPEGTTCKLYGMPILNTPDRPGLELFLAQAPDVFAKRFIIISQKLGASMGLITSPDSSLEKQAYLRALVAQVDYFGTKEYRLSLPKGGTVEVAFDSIGAGDVTEPLTGTTIMIDVPTPSHEESAALAPTNWRLTLSPEQECALRLILLFLEHRKKPLAPYQLTEQISSLITRLSLAPAPEGTMSDLRALLALIGQYHHQVTSYSFDEPLTETLSTPELLLQLARVGYKTYTLSADRQRNVSTLSAQDVADFATKHTAAALRQYYLTKGMGMLAHAKLRTPWLAQNNVRIDFGLFFDTLFAKADA